MAEGLLGSGRKLRSSLDVDECRSVLEEIVGGYRPRRYEHLPAWVDTGFAWLDASRAPSVVISGQDSDNDFLLMALWRTSDGTRVGMFPLGSGEERLLRRPILRHWKARDSSLSSVGRFPAGSIALRPPRLPDRYLQTTLALGGTPATPRNVAALGEMVSQQFLVKAFQFIGSQDPQAAQDFVDEHRGMLDLQRILDDLGDWDTDFLPYIQDLPLRIRGLILDPEIRRRSPFWQRLER